MPRPRKNNPLARRQWHRGHRSQLRFGADYFHEAWGNIHTWPVDRRHEWPGEQVLEEMQLAWSQLGDELKEQYPDKPLFGELVFERGMSPIEAKDHLSSLTPRPAPCLPTYTPSQNKES